jgi:hypothetical protein
MQLSQPQPQLQLRADQPPVPAAVNANAPTETQVQAAFHGLGLNPAAPSHELVNDLYRIQQQLHHDRNSKHEWRAEKEIDKKQGLVLVLLLNIRRDLRDQREVKADQSDEQRKHLNKLIKFMLAQQLAPKIKKAEAEDEYYKKEEREQRNKKKMKIPVLAPTVYFAQNVPMPDYEKTLAVLAVKAGLQINLKNLALVAHAAREVGGIIGEIYAGVANAPKVLLGLVDGKPGFVVAATTEEQVKEMRAYCAQAGIQAPVLHMSQLTAQSYNAPPVVATPQPAPVVEPTRPSPFAIPTVPTLKAR